MTEYELTLRYPPGSIGELQTTTLLIISNVIAPDYRGFADSTGSPDEKGLLLDARSVWDDTIAKIERGRARSGGKREAARSIVIMGHSLGTGVASALVQQLHEEGALAASLTLTSQVSNQEVLFFLHLSLRYLTYSQRRHPLRASLTSQISTLVHSAHAWSVETRSWPPA